MGGGAELIAVTTAVATAVAMSVGDGAATAGAAAGAAAARAGGAAGAAKPVAESVMSVPHCRQFDPGQKCKAWMPIVIFNSCVTSQAMTCFMASLKVASARRRLEHRWPAEIKKEHLAHEGATGAGSGASIAFCAMKSSRILFLIIATGSVTKASLVGGEVTAKRSSCQTTNLGWSWSSNVRDVM